MNVLTGICENGNTWLNYLNCARSVNGINLRLISGRKMGSIPSWRTILERRLWLLVLKVDRHYNNNPTVHRTIVMRWQSERRHQFYCLVAQSVVASDFDSEGCEFESHLGIQVINRNVVMSSSAADTSSKECWISTVVEITLLNTHYNGCVLNFV